MLKKFGKYVLGLLVVYLTVTNFIVWNNRNEPSSVYHDGKLSEILNCESPTGREIQDCNGLICKKELFDRNLARPGERASIISGSYRHSDKPSYSTHVVEVKTSEGKIYFECEMEKSKVTEVKQLWEEDLRKRNLTSKSSQTVSPPAV